MGLQAVFALTFGWRAVVYAQGAGPLIPNEHPINLLAPLDDNPDPITTTSGRPFEALYAYFERSWPWIIGSAAGIAVLWAIFGGIEIMLSGSDSGMRDRGKDRFKNALAGLLLIGLSGLILQILNPIGFTQ
jgi:hypothetical protein